MARVLFHSIRAQLLSIILLTVAPILGLMIYTAAEIRQTDIREAENAVKEIAEFAAKDLGEVIRGGRQLLRTLSELRQVQHDDASACGSLLNKIANVEDPFMNFTVADLEGSVICSGIPLSEPVNVGGGKWFSQTVRTGEFAVGSYEWDRIANQHSVSLAYPILDPQGQVTRVIFASIDLAWLKKNTQSLNIPTTHGLALLDREGTVLFRHPENHERVGKPFDEAAGFSPVGMIRSEFVQAKGRDGKEHFFGVSPLIFGPTPDFYAVASVPKAMALVEAAESFRRSLTGLGVAALFVGFIVWIGGDVLILRRLKRLTRVSNRVAAGDLQVRTNLARGGDELSDLAGNFDQMLDGLETRDRTLRVLYDIGRATTSTLQVGDVLGTLFDKIEATLPYTAMAVWIYNRKTGLLELEKARNLEEKQWRELSIQCQTRGPRGLSWTVFERKAPLAVRDIQSDPNSARPEFFRQQGLISYLGVPLVVDREALGVLGVFTTKAHEFTHEEIEFASTLVAQLAAAVRNAQLYEHMRRLAIDLEKANKIQADYTAMIVHDLRSPVMNIMSTASLLEDGAFGEVTAEQKKWAGKITTASAKLADLISDVLDLSKLEAGQINLVKEKVDVGKLAKSSIEDYLPRAREKEISLALKLDSNIGAIDADSRRLDQVLGNLLSNALKFTPAGGTIEVGARREGTNQIKMWVKDSGIGIPGEDIAGLFEKYKQAGNAQVASEKGTGLGLVICKMIVEAHGGSIEAASEPGTGTTFTITIPSSGAANSDPACTTAA